MPFYDLRCTKCNKEFNIMATVTQRMEQRIACPDCGAEELVPLFTAAHFQIKDKAPACPNSHLCGAGCQHAH